MPQKIATILLATDLSDRSDRALSRSIRLARAHHAKLVILHVIDDAMPADLREDLQLRALKLLDRTAADLAQGVDYQLEIREGDPTEQILIEAGKDRADLLVMGRHRPRLFLDSLRETTMMRVARRGAGAAGARSGRSCLWLGGRRL